MKRSFRWIDWVPNLTYNRGRGRGREGELGRAEVKESVSEKMVGCFVNRNRGRGRVVTWVAGYCLYNTNNGG